MLEGELSSPSDKNLSTLKKHFKIEPLEQYRIIAILLLYV
jgi:hypothetical protein